MSGTQLTVSQAQSFIKSRKHMYDSMIRNRFYLPSFKSPAITQEYMQLVRSGEYWCPKFDEVKLLPCPNPPTKDYLID